MAQLILGSIFGFVFHLIINIDEPNKWLIVIAVLMLLYITWSINRFIETGEF